MHTIFVGLLIVLSLWMIVIILLQRGKGGGLAGAFGGMGGQSAFGTKAGDTFTKITVITALIWFFLCIGVLIYLKQGGRMTGSSGFGNGNSQVTEPGGQSAANSSGNEMTETQ